MKDAFTMAEIQRALALWAQGNNTFEIALTLNVTESAIYNRLPKWRAVFKQAVSV